MKINKLKGCFIPLDLEGDHIIATLKGKQVLCIFNDETMLNAFLQRSHKLVGSIYHVNDINEFLTYITNILERNPEVILGLVTTCNSEQIIYLPLEINNE